MTKTYPNAGPLYIHDSQGNLLGIVFNRNCAYNPGVDFHTEPAAPMQVATIQENAPRYIPAHYHPTRHRIINETHEFLVLIQGSIEVTFYGLDGWESPSEKLSSGDAVLICGGGHSIKILEPCFMYEAKIGPYVSRDVDKVLMP